MLFQVRAGYARLSHVWPGDVRLGHVRSC